MVIQQALSLKLLDKSSFTAFHGSLLTGAVVVAALGPRPAWLVPLAVTVAALAWCVRSGWSAVSGSSMTLTLLPDGNVSLLQGKTVVRQGSLGTRHWCTQALTVLSTTLNGRVVPCVILARQQKTGDYRRLQVWVRQRICNNTP